MTTTDQRPLSALSIPDDGIRSAVDSCFSSLSYVVGWDVGELWTLTPNGLSLLHVFVGGHSAVAQYVPLISEYHSGIRSNQASRSLCKRAMRSRRGFHWQCSKRTLEHSEVPFRSAMAFHMPRDNINGDVFIVMFSLKYLKVTQPRLDFMFWIAHGACVAAFCTNEASDQLFPLSDEGDFSSDAGPLSPSSISHSSVHNYQQQQQQQQQWVGSAMDQYPEPPITTDIPSLLVDTPTNRGGSVVTDRDVGSCRPGRAIIDSTKGLTRKASARLSFTAVAVGSLETPRGTSLSSDDSTEESSPRVFTFGGLPPPSDDDDDADDAEAASDGGGVVTEQPACRLSLDDILGTTTAAATVTASISSSFVSYPVTPKPPPSRHYDDIGGNGDSGNKRLLVAPPIATKTLLIPPPLAIVPAPAPTAAAVAALVTVPTLSLDHTTSSSTSSTSVVSPTSAVGASRSPVTPNFRSGAVTERAFEDDDTQDTADGTAVASITKKHHVKPKKAWGKIKGHNHNHAGVVSSEICAAAADEDDDDEQANEDDDRDDDDSPPANKSGRVVAAAVDDDDTPGGDDGSFSDVTEATGKSHPSLPPAGSESHPVDVSQLNASVCDGTSHSRGDFSFNIDKLRVPDSRKAIPRNIDLSCMVNLKYITRGSNSLIYEAIWQNQPVIIKVLQEEKLRSIVAVHEFDIEFELLSRIDHPHVIAVLGCGTVPRPFIVLEKLKCVANLLDIDNNNALPSLFQKRVFSYAEILNLAKSLADALHYLHFDMHPGATLIHRDLKPENVGLAPDGTLKLFDFGLCRCVRTHAMPDDTYEMTGNTGSLRFMAPEVTLNQKYNEKVDVYSYAIVIWTLARNKMAFRGLNRQSHRDLVVIGGERPKLERNWPRDFSALLERCWHADSTKRPSFSEVSSLLLGMIDKTPAAKARVSPMPSILTATAASAGADGGGNQKKPSSRTFLSMFMHNNK